jgi:ubiquitin C-terminal hydrolase
MNDLNEWLDRIRGRFEAKKNAEANGFVMGEYNRHVKTRREPPPFDVHPQSETRYRVRCMVVLTTSTTTDPSTQLSAPVAATARMAMKPSKRPGD